MVFQWLNVLLGDEKLVNIVISVRQRGTEHLNVKTILKFYTTLSKIKNESTKE